jgi:hypothetical protein
MLIYDVLIILHFRPNSGVKTAVLEGILEFSFAFLWYVSGLKSRVYIWTHSWRRFSANNELVFCLLFRASSIYFIKLPA